MRASPNGVPSRRPTRLFAHKLDQLLASLSPEQARQVQLSTDSIFWDDVPTWPDS